MAEDSKIKSDTADGEVNAISNGKPNTTDGNILITYSKVNVFFNDKPVTLESSKQSGSSIKKAAIKQDVDIKQDFVLSIEKGGGKTDLIGDNEEIFVKENDRFLAIANDDNS